MTPERRKFTTMDLEELKQKVRQGLRVEVDSRKVKDGDVYVVFQENRKYLKDAIKRGAKYIVVQPEYWRGRDISNIDVVFHSDTRQALGELAGAYFGTERQNFVLIGITGTNGKTTTSYLIEHMLKNVGLKVGVIGTINYRWMDRVESSYLTTPGCLELHRIISRMKNSGVDVIVMEVSSHGLSQDRVAGLKFDFAVFTNLTQDHLDYHKDMEDYFKAKYRLFSKYLRERGWAIVNLDDPYGSKIYSTIARSLGYGLLNKGENSLCAEIIKESRGVQKVRCFYGDIWWEMDFPLAGRYNVYNLLAAQGVGLKMGLKKDVFKCFENVSQVPGRMEKIENKKGIHIYIDYAHTPDALERVLGSIREMNFKKVITVFGCGGDRDKTKRPLMGRAASMYSDIVVVTSDNPRGEEPHKIIEDILLGIDGKCELVIEANRKKAIEKALFMAEKGDVVLVAGKGHETYQEIKGIRYPFSDRDVVEELINRNL